MRMLNDQKDSPLASSSTLFFERYARAENENVQMKLIVGLLSVLLIIILLGFVYSMSRPKAIYYIPGATSFGISDPGKVPSSSVRSFAVAWLMGWLNFTPDTVEGVYVRSSKFMAPGLLSHVHGQAADELEKVRRDRLSSAFMLSAEPVVEEDKGSFKVTMEGARSIYMGKEQMSVEAVRYVLVLVKAAVTQEDPYGLNVSDIMKVEVASGKE